MGDGGVWGQGGVAENFLDLGVAFWMSLCYNYWRFSAGCVSGGAGPGWSCFCEGVSLCFYCHGWPDRARRCGGVSSSRSLSSKANALGRIGQMGRRAPARPQSARICVVCGSLRRANRCGRCLLKLSPEIADGESEVGDLV